MKKLLLLLLLSLGLSVISYASESNYSSEGNLNKDEPITGKYDEGTRLRIELQKKD